jgi:hypothetical protein
LTDQSYNGQNEEKHQQKIEEAITVAGWLRHRKYLYLKRQLYGTCASQLFLVCLCRRFGSKRFMKSDKYGFLGREREGKRHQLTNPRDFTVSDEKLCYI